MAHGALARRLIRVHLSPVTRTGSLALLALAYVGFVSLGLPDSVLGAAWPVMHVEFGVPLEGAGQLVLVTTAGTVVASALGGRLLGRLGVGQVLAGSTVIAGAALVLFAIAPAWWCLVLAAALAGTGGGAVDTALNGYVARHHGARHMSWLHACYGIGATVGPLAISMALAADRSWRTAYTALAAIELGLAVAFVATLARWPREARAADAPAGPARARPTIGAGVLFFFVYGGLEASAGLWIASYLVTTRGVTPAVAGVAAAVYWAALTAGRVATGVVAARAGEARLVRWSCALALAAAAALCLPATPAALAVVAFAGLGLALACIYPLTMHLTPRRFGDAASVRLVGYQVAACSAGIALVPWAVGALAARTSLLLVPPSLAVLAIVLNLLERRLPAA